MAANLATGHWPNRNHHDAHRENPLRHLRQEKAYPYFSSQCLCIASFTSSSPVMSVFTLMLRMNSGIPSLFTSELVLFFEAPNKFLMKAVSWYSTDSSSIESISLNKEYFISIAVMFPSFSFNAANIYNFSTNVLQHLIRLELCRHAVAQLLLTL